MSSPGLSCSIRNNGKHLLTYSLHGLWKNKNISTSELDYLPELLVCTQAKLPAKHWSRPLGWRKKCLPKGWASKAENLNCFCFPELDVALTQIYGWHLSCGLWPCMKTLKQSTAVPVPPTCLNTALVLSPLWCCCLRAVYKADLSSYSTVILSLVEILGYVTVSSFSYQKLLPLAKETAANLSLDNH